jgi:hypothetical protein
MPLISCDLAWIVSLVLQQFKLDARLDAPLTLVEPIGCGCLQLPRMMLKWMKLGMGLGTWTNGKPSWS